MAKVKYTYQSYDYSFLKPKDSDPWYLPNAIRVAARTIGFDMTPVEPMNEPVGQLFYFEPTITATTTDGGGQITATTYEPLHTGGWEVTFTPPTPVPTEPVEITSSTATTYTQEEEKQTEPPYYRLPSLYPHYTDIERYRKARSKAYFNNVKLRWKNTYFKNHGKNNILKEIKNE